MMKRMPVCLAVAVLVSAILVGSAAQAAKPAVQANCGSLTWTDSSANTRENITPASINVSSTMQTTAYIPVAKTYSTPACKDTQVTYHVRLWTESGPALDEMIEDSSRIQYMVVAGGGYEFLYTQKGMEFDADGAAQGQEETMILPPGSGAEMLSMVGLPVPLPASAAGHKLHTQVTITSCNAKGNACSVDAVIDHSILME